MNFILRELINSKQFESITIVFIIVVLLVIETIYKNHKENKIKKSKNLQKVIEYDEKPKGKQRKIYKETLLKDCFGKAISSDEIDYVERIENSAIILNTYLFSKEHFKFNYQKKKIEIRTKRIKIIKNSWLSLYLLTGTLFIFITVNLLTHKSYNSSSIIFLIALILTAILSLRQTIVVIPAESLNKELNQQIIGSLTGPPSKK